ncbi:hypothetical protein [Geomonas sp.]|uniref:hypothetical protein n=1 Tax=Geomonas sp. TaxID=2651584 RepID=UPI002B4AA856|nr:hypothetical protein [Geomonas sp.]
MVTPQYQIVNQCLRLLRQANLSRLDALRIETRLIQLKRLLLITEGLNLLGEEHFEELLSGMCMICEEECRKEALLMYLGQLEGMITCLGEGLP